MNDVAKESAPKATTDEKPAAEAGDKAAAHANGREELPTLRDLGLLKSLMPFLKPHRALLIAALCLVPISSGATLLQPYLMKKTVDAVLVQQDQGLWLRYVVFFGLAIFMEFLAGFCESYALQLAGQRSMVDLRREVFRHAQRMRVRYYDKTPVGRVLTRVTNDVDSLSELFSSGAVMAIADIVTLLGIVAFMLVLDWRLSLITFTALPPLAVGIEWIRKRAREAFRDIRARISELNTYLSEQVQGILVVQAYGREAASAEEYRVINDGHRVANYSAIHLDAMLYSVVETVSMVCVALVLWYASVRAGVIEGDSKHALYIGTVVAFYKYIQQFFVPIRELSTKYTIIQSALAAAERVFGFLGNDDIETDEPPAPSSVPQPVDASKVASAMTFSHVDFSYRSDDPVLRDVSFEVKPGEHVALVGATGAGKTTTISLMLRLYEHTGGEIRLHGRDIRAMTRAELRSHFSVVPQDVFLFAGTVAQNIAFAPEHIDEARVRDALIRVGAIDLVERRQGGIHARVEERGGNFSAGERQLFAFARALYRDRPFLVLDEATANIDSETEGRLQTAVSELMRGRTALVIAHRLSTIQKADRILVFHHGQIVEQGTHQELLALGQVYSHLHRLQFGDV